ncbi:MAG TPA: RNA polymerase sigma factor [Pyrinomonadaceae bacterium]|nr:RNA polymerase sigma factor [Pyrinomonadaceae bacterium]
MTASTPTSDAELLRLMLAGDEEAFTALYRRRQAGVYRFALQMSGSETVAEDVTQEVFMVLMRDGHNYDPARGSLAAFLYGVARNLVLRSFQRERAFVALHDEAADGDSLADERLISHDDPLGDLTRGETIERVRGAVLALPAHYREVVVLCELHEMSYAEAAGVLGCAVGTIRSRLHRARGMLVEKLRSTTTNSAGDTASQTFNTARCFA